MKLLHTYCALAVLFLFCPISCVPTCVEDVMHLYELDQVSSVDFMFTDITGKLHSVTLPINEVSRALERGLKFDGSSIAGFSSIYESDMHLKPDISTASLSYTSHRVVGRILCDVAYLQDVPYEGDPRSLLKEQVNNARKNGYEFYIGPELEFFLFADNQSAQAVDANSYFQHETSSMRDEQNRILLDYLVNNGIRVEKIHHEVAPGQHEISIAYADAVTMADQIILAKHYISLFAKAHGMHASFMPKPIANRNGSGMHIHFSVYDTISNSNAFYDANNEGNLSLFAQQFIAGVLKYMPTVNAFANPTINSYKRLVAGFEAPVYVCWATKNRSALIRIPQIEKDQANAARAELRSPDAMANPYILFNLLFAAGNKGVTNAITLMPAVNENLYKLSLDAIRERNIAILPETLSKALDLLYDNDFAHDVVGSSIIHSFLTIKHKEIESFCRSITDWELNSYL